MASVLLVGVALGGVCAYVWSAIVQAEGPGSARSNGGAIAPRALLMLKQAGVRLLVARRRRREARAELELEAGPRRLRFEETAELTMPSAALAATPRPQTWEERPSRFLSAIQLVLLIALLGGAVAAATLGIARLVAQAVASH